MKMLLLTRASLNLLSYELYFFLWLIVKRIQGQASLFGDARSLRVYPLVILLKREIRFPGIKERTSVSYLPSAQHLPGA